MKTMMQNKLKKFAALFLIAAMCVGITAPYVAAPQGEIIYINTPEDLVELSKNCKYDKWSVGKTVILSNNISLTEVEFEPIPYFAGVFDGQGYTISDFELDGSYEPAGLFGTTKQGAIIQNLKVTGSVIPTGDSTNVGSIVGKNNGIIKNCYFSGVVSGENAIGGIVGSNQEAGVVSECGMKGSVFGEFATGGIVGSNKGNIIECINEGYINNTNEETSLSIDDIGTNLLVDLYAINSSDVTSGATDTGGIAGYSSGVVAGCVNRETIGYSRVGYNVGGIIGRNSGYVYDCENHGEVLGRKDIGGIVGQAEPYVIEDITSSKLATLEGQFKVLEEQIENASDKVKDSGEDAKNSMKNISSYMSQLSDSMDKLNELLDAENKKVTSDLETLEDTVDSIDYTMDLLDVSLTELKKTLDALDAALDELDDRTSTEIDALRENITDVRKLIEDQRQLIEEMENVESRDEMEELLKDSAEILGDILEILEEMLTSPDSYLEYTDTAFEEIRGYRSDIEESAREIKGYLDEIKGYIEELETKEKVEDLQDFKDSTTDVIDVMADDMESIADEMELLDENLSNTGDELSDDLEEIEDQMKIISNTVEDILDETDDTPEDAIMTETTVADIAATTYGKIATSINYAQIEGDINIGGIAGNMSVEYENDPEEEISSDMSWRERKTYELKTILYNCTNKGKITGNKDTVGAICGQMDIGIISTCYGYGTATSEGGGYVGGIAGISRATITNCIANCGLSGEKYVGGIIGSGFETEKGKSSVENCYTMVRITECEQFEGAIAGCDAGSFINNYFVSDTLQGINRVSYEGKAQPISYEELLQIPNLPDELKGFTLTFVADDVVIKSIDFNYGDSFGEEMFPEVPEKEGYDGVWDITDLSNLCFDTEVTAEYTPYVTAIKSEGLRQNGRPVILLEGDFSAEDTLTLTAMEITQQLQEELKMSGDVVEAWSIKFSDDGHIRHNIRFLLEKKMENAKIYVKEEGKWTRAETTEIGSYQSFQVVGNEVELVVVSGSTEIILIVATIVMALLILVAIIMLEKKTHLFSRIIKSLMKAVGAKKLITIILVAGAIIGLGFAIYIGMMPKVRISAELAALSKDIIAADNQSMKLDLTADIRSNHIQLNSNVYVVEQDDMTVLVLEENDRAVYLEGNAIYLKNGKGFVSGETESNSTSLLEILRKLFESTEITRTNDLEKTIYSITATGEEAKTLLGALVPSTEGQLVSAGDTQIRIIAANGILESIEIEGNATMKDSMETTVEVSAKLYDFTELEEGEYEIPRTVIKAIENTDTSSLTVMEEETYRLLLAWLKFDAQEETGTVSLDVECGPINMETNADWTEIVNGIANVSNSKNIEKVPSMIYDISMEGEYSCEKLGDSYIFTITLDEAAIANLAKTISPEITTQMVNLSDGEVKVVVENNEIASFGIEIGGKVTILLSDVDASVEAEFVFD